MRGAAKVKGMTKHTLTYVLAALFIGVGAAQGSGGACGAPETKLTLTQSLKLDLPASLLVLEKTETETSAFYRVLARMSQTAVVEEVGKALTGWTQTSAQRGFGGTTVLYTSGDARTLRLRVNPVGRSNLFRVELRLYSKDE